jgi:hypothetical protein
VVILAITGCGMLRLIKRPNAERAASRSRHGSGRVVCSSVVDERTLQLVEDAVASRAPASVRHPIRDELFPQLDEAQTVEEAEKAIHDAARALSWLGDALVADAPGEPQVGDALACTVPQMLAIQDELERKIGTAVGEVTARKAIVAQETLRRFFVAGVQAPRRESSDPVAIPIDAKPSIDYMRDVALRLALLIIAVEHMVARGSVLVASLADKAFETSQTLRRATRAVGSDLTPWIDAPAATRARRIVEAAKGFWNSLTDEQRRAVDEAWGERVELSPRWPQPSS